MSHLLMVKYLHNKQTKMFLLNLYLKIPSILNKKIPCTCYSLKRNIIRHWGFINCCNVFVPVPLALGGGSGLWVPWANPAFSNQGGTSHWPIFGVILPFSWRITHIHRWISLQAHFMALESQKSNSLPSFYLIAVLFIPGCQCLCWDGWLDPQVTCLVS